jgi:hypothetical protein
MSVEICSAALLLILGNVVTLSAKQSVAPVQSQVRHVAQLRPQQLSITPKNAGKVAPCEGPQRGAVGRVYA